jgi:hypothetical protein
MRPCLLVIRGFWLLLGLGIVLGPPAGGWSQGQLGGTKDSLQKAFRENSVRRDKLFSGEEAAAAEDKSAMRIAEAAANWYIYRLTHLTENPLDVQKEFSSEIVKMMERSFDKKEKNNRVFINMFGPALVSSMKEVLARDVKTDPATVINAAMMLPTMAKLKQDEVSGYLIELVKEGKTHDVVRLYALKGLKEAMPITIQPGDELELTDKAQNNKRKRDTELVEALTNYIERPVNTAGMSVEEVEAVRYVRREAIISLAQAGAPAVLAVNMKKKAILQGAVAPTLLKVLATPFDARASRPGDIKPPPSLQEKIEAALGLCATKHPNMPEYDPSLATYLIGRTIVDFVDDYNRDLANIGVVGKGRKLPYIGYRTDAKRLGDALTDFAKNAPQAKILKGPAQHVLGSMTKSDPYLPLANSVDLRKHVSATRPTTGNVFKTLSKPINLPDP